MNIRRGWKAIQRKKKKKFTGQKGYASIQAQGKFKAAVLKIPMSIQRCNTFRYIRISIKYIIS